MTSGSVRRAPLPHLEVANVGTSGHCLLSEAAPCSERSLIALRLLRRPVEESIPQPWERVQVYHFPDPAGLQPETPSEEWNRAMVFTCALTASYLVPHQKPCLRARLCRYYGPQGERLQRQRTGRFAGPEY